MQKDRTAGWISKTYKGGKKRLFPKKYSRDYVNTPRIDHNKAAAYNAQRSKAVVGGGDNVEPKFDNNFMEPVPKTGSLTTFDKVLDGKTGYPTTWRQRSKRGEVVDTIKELKSFENKTLQQLWKDACSDVDNPNRAHWFNVAKIGGYLLVHRGNEYMFAVQLKDNKWMVSRTYHGRSETMMAFDTGIIGWIIS